MQKSYAKKTGIYNTNANLKTVNNLSLYDVIIFIFAQITKAKRTNYCLTNNPLFKYLSDSYCIAYIAKSKPCIFLPKYRHLDMPARAAIIHKISQTGKIFKLYSGPK